MSNNVSITSAPFNAIQASPNNLVSFSVGPNIATTYHDPADAIEALSYLTEVELDEMLLNICAKGGEDAAFELLMCLISKRHFSEAFLMNWAVDRFSSKISKLEWIEQLNNNHNADINSGAYSKLALWLKVQ